MYGLSETDFKAITVVFAGNNRIEQVILFGSRATGTHRPGSDVDLALKGRDLKHNDLLDLSIALDELWLPIRFDLILYDRIKEPALLDQINRFGKELFPKPSLV
jgi:predicted nucleotidyltransferase